MNIVEARDLTDATIKYNLFSKDKDDFARNIVLYFQSLPGIGKTSIIGQVCKDNDYVLRVISLSSYDSGEIAGIPILNKDKNTYSRAKPDWMKTDPDKNYVFFFDECSQAPTANINPIAMLMNERRLGEHELGDNVAIVCAGNKMEHRAGTNPLPSHFKDRVTFCNIDPCIDSFLAYGNKKNLHHYILGFLRNMPQNLSVFNPAVDACPSPRSWMRVDTILKMKLPYKLQSEALKGQIGEACQADFMHYLRVADKMPDPVLILAGKSYEKPKDSVVMYALCAALATLVTTKTAKNFVEYLSGLPNKEFAAFTIRDALSRDAKLKGDKHIRSWFFADGRDLLL